jgi:hypothetical protein
MDRITYIKLKVLLSLFIVISICSNSYSQLIPNLGGQRTGTSSLQFLKIGQGARGTGMGETFVAVADDFSALYYNPAGLVSNNDNGIFLSHTEWFVDTRLEYLGGVYHFGQNAFGFSVTSLRTEDMKVTDEFHPYGTGDYFRFSDLAIGLTYARRMTEQFSFGATVKYVEETLGLLKTKTILGDLATFYRTGLGTTRFAVMISNFGGQNSPTGEVNLIGGRTVNSFQSFPPPTVFKIGFAFEPILNSTNRLTTSVQLNSPNDNKENLNFGAEYSYKEFLFFRGGYKLNVDAESFSFGAGLKFSLSFAKSSFDYSIAKFGELGFAHRISMNIIFPSKSF